jgi:hypothetical protein
MGISRFPIRPEVDLKNINSASPRLADVKEMFLQMRD